MMVRVKFRVRVTFSHSTHMADVMMGNVTIFLHFLMYDSPQDAVNVYINYSVFLHKRCFANIVMGKYMTSV